MSISLRLEMAQCGRLADSGRTALVSGELRLSVSELSRLAEGGSGVIAASGARCVAYVGSGGAMLPLLLFASARAAVPVIPLNYRLSAAGLRALIGRLSAGRKMVYLPMFDAAEWLRLIDVEAVTSATVVPTMLDRIVTALDAAETTLPTLRTLAYGGSKVSLPLPLPLPLVRKALTLLPEVGFVNAYGLTETSSTIAVLTPDDHRAALASDDATVCAGSGRWAGQCRRSRYRSAPRTGPFSGRTSPASSLYVASRSRAATPVSARCWTSRVGSRPRTSLTSTPTGACSSAAAPTTRSFAGARTLPRRNRGRARRASARARLCGSRTPDRVVFRDALPTNATGKVLRRELDREFNEATKEPA